MKRAVRDKYTFCHPGGSIYFRYPVKALRYYWIVVKKYGVSQVKVYLNGELIPAAKLMKLAFNESNKQGLLRLPA